MTTSTVTRQDRTADHRRVAMGKTSAVGDEIQTLWAMTRRERVAAMWRGELTLRQLTKWSSRAPHEIPLLAGEFAWIVMLTPDWAEAGRHVPAGTMASEHEAVER